MGSQAGDWESLIEELSAGLDAAERAENAAVAADLAEAEMAGVELADRIRARRGAPLRLRLRTGEDVTGTVLEAASQWVLLREHGRRALIPMVAIHVAQPLSEVAPPAGEVDRRLGLGRVLRAIAREGAVVRVACDAGAYTGRMTRVGRDHLDLRSEGGIVTVAFPGITVVSAS